MSAQPVEAVDVEARTCARPGCDGRAVHGQPFCGDDRREARDALADLAGLYTELREAMVPSSSESAEPRVSGSKEAPLPFVLEAFSLAEEIALHLGSYEDSLRIVLSEPLQHRLASWVVKADGRVVLTANGLQRHRIEAMRRLYVKRGAKVVVEGEWPEPLRRDAVRHPEEAAQVVASASWLTPRLDPLLSSPLGVSVALDAIALRRRAKLILGGGSGDVWLPMPCPAAECGEQRLVRANGTSYVECRSCGLIKRDDELGWFVRVLAVDMPDLLLPAVRAAEVVGIKPRNITAWDARGHLEHHGCDVRTKRKLYRVGDVLRCATRKSR